MIGSIIILVILGLFLYSLVSKPSKMYLVKNKCEKQPHLDCPLTVEMTDRGGIHAEGHFKCCKIMQRNKDMNEAWCHMVPGQDYNGISITQGFHAAALRQRESYKNLDCSGPLGYNKENLPKE